MLRRIADRQTDASPLGPPLTDDDPLPPDVSPVRFLQTSRAFDLTYHFAAPPYMSLAENGTRDAPGGPGVATHMDKRLKDD